MCESCMSFSVLKPLTEGMAVQSVLTACTAMGQAACKGQAEGQAKGQT